jgi:hypothetical protein
MLHLFRAKKKAKKRFGAMSSSRRRHGLIDAVLAA